MMDSRSNGSTAQINTNIPIVASSSSSIISVGNSPDNMGIARYEQLRRHTPSVDYLFANRDVLARRLKNRPGKDVLIDRNIIPANATSPQIHDKVTQLERKKTGEIIQRKIRARPSRQTLVQRHILSDSRVDPSLAESITKLERKKIADQLNERLLTRPGPIELIQDHILPVEQPLQHVLDQENLAFDAMLSPEAESPSAPDLEQSVNTPTYNSASSPPFQNTDPLSAVFEQRISQFQEENRNMAAPAPTESQISLSQRENKKLVQSVNKKQKQSKPKVKKLKFHNCMPDMPANNQSINVDDSVDDHYKQLLEQQTLYLRLQVMQKNAMLNALNGNTSETFDRTVTEEKIVEPSILKSIEEKKYDELRCTDLKDMLRQRGLIVSGQKAKLIERLVSYENGTLSPTEFSHSGGNVFSDNVKNLRNLKLRANSNTSDQQNSVIQVTTYATDSGETFQLVQAVPNGDSYHVVQALPTQTSQGVPDYQMIPSEQNVLFNRQNSNPLLSPQESLSLSSTSQQLQFQLSQAQSPYLIQRSNESQATNLMRQNANTDSTGRTVLQPESPETSHLSRSVPASPFSNLYFQTINPSIGQQSSRASTDQQNQTHMLDSSNPAGQNHRSRAASEPYIDNPVVSSKSLQFIRSSPFFTMSGGASSGGASNRGELKIQSNPLANLGVLEALQRRQTSTISEKSNSSTKSPENYDEIMEIIGELSTPSPSSTGSPLPSSHPLPPSSSHPLPPSFSTQNVTYQPSKALQMPERPAKSQLNKFLSSVSPTSQLKHFNSVPENINNLGQSPVQNNLVHSPFGSLSANTFTGSFSNLTEQSHGSFNNLNQSSSLGNIPQNTPHFSGTLIHSSSQSNYCESPNNFLTSEYRDSPTSFIDASDILTTNPENSASMYSASPANEENLMEYEYSQTSVNDNSSLNWLDLNVVSTSPSRAQLSIGQTRDLHASNSFPSIKNCYQIVNPNLISPLCANNRSGVGYYDNNNLLSQTSLYGSPKPNDGFVSLFDLEGGEF